MIKEEIINKAIELEFGSGNIKGIRESNSSLVKVAEHLYDLMTPSLPSNLDEAAKMYRNFREECGIKDPVMLNEIEEAHYAGAEWMAGQISKAE